MKTTQTAKSDTEDCYEQLKRMNYQLYRDAIMYSEIAIMRSNAKLASRQASEVEGCFVSFAVHVLNTIYEDPKI